MYKGDPRVSRGNVMMLKMNKFERLFVFYPDDEEVIGGTWGPEEILKRGEKKLQQFMKSLELLVKLLSLEDRSMHG